MTDRLLLAIWPKPTDCPFTLGEVEVALLAVIQPPLNLQGGATPWTAQVKAARAVMAEEAKSWATEKP